MDDSTLLVLADPADRYLAMLSELPDTVNIAVGKAPEAFVRAAANAGVILNWTGTRELMVDVLAMAPRVRWIHTKAAGLDELLSPELIANPAVLTNSTGIFSAALGEWALGAILYFAKDFRRLIRNQAAGVWETFDVQRIAGRTVGIVGYGDIGRAVASRVHAMGMRVLALTRSGPQPGKPDPLADRVYGPASLREMLAECDYVVLSPPLTAETRGMMGAAEFAAMRTGSVLINIGRGAVVDEPSMLAALSEGRIRGAALDVFAQEPLPAGHPLYSMENVLLSPHSADHTADWLERAMQFFLEQFERFRKGEPLANIVPKPRGY